MSSNSTYTQKILNQVGESERATQNRVVKLFQNPDRLNYRYLGNWEKREGNSNIEVDILREHLKKQSYSDVLINKAIYELQNVANNQQNDLYNLNKKVYKLLRYGVQVKSEFGEQFQTVHFVDWKNPENNDFGIAEEVTIKGNQTRRPDLVIYVNGIALGVIELKRSSVSINEGIRQNLSNQREHSNKSFFATIQYVMAGNDSQGLQYGTILTEEKYWLKWKEDEQDNSELKLDKYLGKMYNKSRILEIIHDCVLFDGGIKKLPRVHQYFGFKATQKRVLEKEGGIIFHTQGSGKSVLMVLIAKWILENNPKARIIVLTDRTELDKQIERVFNDAGESLKRTSNGQELMSQLTTTDPRIISSLIHKFGKDDDVSMDDFVKELENNPVKTIGELFVFVDECHRTQSGRMHKIMKAVLPNAMFIGFTGTPLLKIDKKTSHEVFGSYIHTYKFKEAVQDGVVLDLCYEGRDIDQTLTSTDRIDQWFDAKTKGLNDFQKSELKKKWATMQNVLSSKSRMDRVVSDIVFDFSTKSQLSNGKGNAILVASSILEVCKYYELFNRTEFRGYCAIVTSYNPANKDIKTEDTGADTETDKVFIYKTYTEILKSVEASGGKSKTEVYEDDAKVKFIKEPANMKILIVVSKLLTGFDAPSCTYLYIDKFMQDHGLFQAICRVNRLDGEDKQFGYIVDYKQLFENVTDAINVYTSELDTDLEGNNKSESDILLQSRVAKGRERLDEALESIRMLCEAVNPPKDKIDYYNYFCGNSDIQGDLKFREVQRTALYKATVALIRAYANIAEDIENAGYNQTEINDIDRDLKFYLELREEIKNLSGEKIDLKTYEADMRHLIDNYIQASEVRKITPFDDIPLLEIMENNSILAAIDSLPTALKGNKSAVAETIENNVRNKIIKEFLIDPAFFEKMSKVLDELIKARKTKALAYEDYLKQISILAKKITEGGEDNQPLELNTKGKRALFNNLGNNLKLALDIDTKIRITKKADWRGNLQKEKEIKGVLFHLLEKDKDEMERIFAIIKENYEY
jgi:type I restriction enzyme, R subunit